MPGVSSGDWGRSGDSRLCLRDSKPMGAVESLLSRVLLEALFEDKPPSPSPSLQQVSLRLALSAPSVASSLCGMRTEKYVEDSAAVLKEPPFSQEQLTRGLLAVRAAAEELGCENRGFW